MRAVRPAPIEMAKAKALRCGSWPAKSTKIETPCAHLWTGCLSALTGSSNCRRGQARRRAVSS
jgi:hypothetical protein